jgi:hypothetical protein
LKAFIEEDPHVYRDEMVDYLAKEFDVDVSVTTISRTLQKEGISQKKVSFSPSFIASHFFCFVANFSFKESQENTQRCPDTTGSCSYQNGVESNSCSSMKVSSTRGLLTASLDGPL